MMCEVEKLIIRKFKYNSWGQFNKTAPPEEMVSIQCLRLSNILGGESEKFN